MSTANGIKKVDSLASHMSTSVIDLDVILNEVGTFGKYQMISFTFICIPIMFNAVFTLGYIFTAGTPSYRCEVPQCENYTEVPKENWLQYAVPFEEDDIPEKCLRYASTTTTQDATCASANFNRSQVEECDRFVYETAERTITSEWNITCDQNQWKLTLVGTINNLGQFFCLPLTGYVSDNYGRRTALVIALMFGGVFGILRSFSVSYGMFLATEFLDPLFSAGCYTSAFVLGMEFLGAEHRVLGGCIISCFYAVGGIMIGVVGYLFPYWRHFLLVLYAPCLLGFFYLFFLPESVRWLMTRERYADVAKIIEKVAKVNGRQLSEISLAQLENSKALEKSNAIDKVEPRKFPLIAAFKSAKLVIRLAVCSFCWLTNTFVYYGLNLSAVSLAGNKYFNFILSNVIEIPAHLLAWLMVNKIGRRWSMCGSLILAGLSCIAMEFIPEDEDNVKFFLYLIGKFSISISFTIVYVYTAELFPTSLRNSLLGICSMFGRFGSISAPQTPLLAVYFPSLPFFLFGGTSILAGVFSLTFPETLNTKLPDTIEEAETIGTEAEPKIPE